MPASLQTAVVQHTLDVADLYKQSCALKNGLPDKPPRVVIGDLPQPQQPVAQPATVEIASGIRPWVKTAALVTASLLTGGGLAGIAATAAVALARPSAETDVGTAVEAPAVPVDRDASLYQYLQDQGLHVPPEKRGR